VLGHGHGLHEAENVQHDATSCRYEAVWHSGGQRGPLPWGWRGGVRSGQHGPLALGSAAGWCAQRGGCNGASMVGPARATSVGRRDKACVCRAACLAFQLDDERWKKEGEVVDSLVPHVKCIVSMPRQREEWVKIRLDPDETRNQILGT
jgi:hypothetical protein